MTVAFDTLAQAKRLREAGFDEKQAEALTALVRDAVAPVGLSGLATKTDLAGLATRAELAAGLASRKADLLQWMIWLVLGIIATNIATMFGLVKLLGH